MWEEIGKAFVSMVKKWACNHKWERLETIRVFENNSDTIPLYIIAYLECKQCGKHKKINM